MPNFIFDLQTFGEGGGGTGGSAGANGSAAAPSAGTVNTGDAASDSGVDLTAVPERYKNIAEETFGKRKASQKYNDGAKNPEPKAESAKTQTEKSPDLSYEEMIRSDKYKDDHAVYMKRIIGERFKHYQGLEESAAKSAEILAFEAQRYGLDPKSETFHADLLKSLQGDDNVFERYAIEHDCSVEEARRIIPLEMKARSVEEQEKALEKTRQAMEQEERNRQEISKLIQRGEQTKARFPEFDLQKEMQNERFVRVCAATGGDTTAAYIAVHADEIYGRVSRDASAKAAQATANAVAANLNRPVENGLSAGPALSAPAMDPSKLTKADFDRIRDDYLYRGIKPQF